jgi:hypothetical protein
LRKAAVWVVVAPFATLAFLIIMKNLKNSAQSSNFGSVIAMTKNKMNFSPTSFAAESRGKWPSKQKQGSEIP